MQENTPREVELNFSSNEERIEDLEAARAELSGELDVLPDAVMENAADNAQEELAADNVKVEAAPVPAPMQPRAPPAPLPCGPRAFRPALLHIRAYVQSMCPKPCPRRRT